jgi:hypothetical protein
VYLYGNPFVDASVAVVLAMVPLFTGELFTAEDFARWAIADVPEREPLTVFGDDRAAALLARADVLLTGWAAALDGAMLARALRLRAVVTPPAR